MKLIALQCIQTYTIYMKDHSRDSTDHLANWTDHFIPALRCELPGIPFFRLKPLSRLRPIEPLLHQCNACLAQRQQTYLSKIEHVYLQYCGSFYWSYKGPHQKTRSLLTITFGLDNDTARPTVRPLPKNQSRPVEVQRRAD